MIKSFIQKILGIIGLRLSQVPIDGLTGVNLFKDLKTLIKTDSPVCLDVGANIGQTIEHLSKTFKTPYIYAFEPSSEIFRVLQSTVSGERIHLYQQALGKNVTRQEFINYERPCLSSFYDIDDTPENRFKDVKEKQREQVEINTVDHFMHEHNISHVDLLKIDTQGFDMEVIAGAEQALENGAIKYVLIELSFIRMYLNQPTVEQVINYLNAKGFYLIDYHEKVRQNDTLAWCTALFGRR